MGSPDNSSTAGQYRSGPSATQVAYYDYDGSRQLACYRCKWEGAAGNASPNYFAELFDVRCPECDTMLLIVPYPTEDDVRAAAALGKEKALDDLFDLEQMEQWRAKAEALALTETSELPELAGERLDFDWDIDGPDDEPWTVIRCRDVVVWRELAYWEGWERFNEVYEILERRYGSRFGSLTPTEESEMYLFGDDLSAPRKLRRARTIRPVE